MGFLKSQKFIRYHDLFTKVYLGYMEPEEFQTMVPTIDVPKTVKVLVAIEKNHSGGIFITYFMQHSRKKLDNITIENGNVTLIKKDPYGVTVTEVVHILKTMHPLHKLHVKDIQTVEKLIRDYKV